MAIVLDLPTTTLFMLDSSPDESVAESAVDLIEGTAEEQLDTLVRIILRKPIEDPVTAFAALIGEQFDGRVDPDGDVYIQHGEHRIYMEEGDFEPVVADEPAASKPARKPRKKKSTTAAAETVTAAAETITAAGETTAAAAETAAVTGPATDAELAAADQAAEEFSARELAAAVAVAETATVAVANLVTELTAKPAVDPAAVAEQAAIATDAKLAAAERVVVSAFERYQKDRREIERHIGELMLRAASLKREATTTKKAAEVATDELEELIDSWESGKYEQGLKAESRSTADERGAALATAAIAAVTPTAGGPTITLPPASTAASTGDMTAKLREEHRAQERYNQVLEAAPIGELGLQPKLEERLIEAGATTILKLERLRADIGLGREKWPKGVGEGKVTTIENAIQAWLTRNSTVFQVEESPEPEGTAPLNVAPPAASPPAARAITLPPASTPPASTPPDSESSDPTSTPVAVHTWGSTGPSTQSPDAITVDDL